MYSAQTTNGLGVTDGTGTINPAALNSSGKISPGSAYGPALCDTVTLLLGRAPFWMFVADIGHHLGTLANSAASISPDTSPRGLKRSRSPDTYGDLPAEDNFGDGGTLVEHPRRLQLVDPVASPLRVYLRALPWREKLANADVS